MWMNRNKLKEMYPDIKWKRASKNSTVKYEGLFQDVAVIFAEQSEREVKGETWPVWVVTVPMAKLSVTDKRLRDALSTAEATWLGLKKQLEEVAVKTAKRPQLVLC